MKTALAILMVAGMMAMAFDIRRTPPVKLKWDYATNHLSTNLTFYIYGTKNTNLPMNEWTMLTNVIGTKTTATFRVSMGRWYFVATASNYLESEFSNVVTYQMQDEENILNDRRNFTTSSDQ